MKIAISGTSGIVGGFLAEYYSNSGVEVITIHNSIKRQGSSEIITYESLRDVDISKIDVVIHAGAAIPKKNSSDSAFDYIGLNLYTTKLIAEWAANNSRTKFIYISSTHIKEFLEFPISLQELNSINEIEIQKYFLSKLLCEFFLKVHHSRTGMQTAIVRIGTPISENYCGSGFINILMQNALEQKVTNLYSDIEEILNLTWLMDVAAAIQYIKKENLKLMTLDLVSSSSSLKEISSALSKILKADVELKQSKMSKVKRYYRRDTAGKIKDLNLEDRKISEILKGILKVGDV